MDYGKIYGGVAFFGIWADGSARSNGARDAMAILAEAVEQTEDRDLRHDRDVLEALDYLTDLVDRLPPATAYRAALAIQHPIERRQALKVAHDRLRQFFGGMASDGKI